MGDQIEQRLRRFGTRPLKRFGIWQNIGDEPASVAGLHRFRIKHHRQKRLAACAEVNVAHRHCLSGSRQRWQRRMRLPRAKERAGSSRETFGAQAKDSVISHGSR